MKRQSEKFKKKKLQMPNASLIRFSFCSVTLFALGFIYRLFSLKHEILMFHLILKGSFLCIFAYHKRLLSLTVSDWFMIVFLPLYAHRPECVCGRLCVSVSVLHYLVPSLLSQQLLREMQQMASRPFATINVALETDEEPPDLIGGNVKVSVTF